MCIFIKSFLWSLADLKRNSFCPSLFWVTDEVYFAYYSNKNKKKQKKNTWGWQGECLIATDLHTRTHDGGINGLNLHGKGTPFFKTGKYFKIMQTRATLALLLPCIWTIYKLKNTDFLFLFLWCFFFSLFPPPPRNIFAPLQSFQHSATYCKQGQDN